MKDLSPLEYDAVLRSDFWFFVQRCFSELNPQAAFAENWHLEVIAAKLNAIREGKIRRLIINSPYLIDFVLSIFHPTCRRRPEAIFGGPRVESPRIIYPAERRVSGR
jgi:hypothetical protein